MSLITRAWKSAFSPFDTPFEITAPIWDENTGRWNTPPIRNKVPLTQDSALSIGAVYRSVSILSNIASRLEPEVYRGKEQLDVPAFVSRPDLNQPISFFLEETVSSLAVTGNAYWLIDKNSAGNVNNLRVLNPNECVIEYDEDRRRYRLSWDHQYFYEGEYRHLKLFRLPTATYGAGPIQLIRAELENALDLREYQARWFNESGVATGVLSTDQPLSEEWANLYRERFTEAMSGWNRTAVLGSGLSYQSTYLNPRDAQFLEAVNFSTQQIARAFGIPTSIMSLALEGNSNSYSNVRDELANFYRFTVTQYVGEVEDALSELLPRGQKVRLNPDPLLKMNKYDRYQTYEMGLKNGFLSRQEVRDMEGMQGALPDLEDIVGGTKEYQPNNPNAKEATSQQANLHNI